MTPLVSFIVLSYNYAHFIGKTIESILSQTIDNFEVIIIDDNSRDNSLDIIRAYHDRRIRLIVNETNLGGAGSFNKALMHSRGDFIANVDADDWIEPAKTEKQLGLAYNRSADIVGTWVNWVDPSGQPHPNRLALEALSNRDVDYNVPETWVVQNSLCRSSTLVRRSFHESHGLMDPELIRAPDFELWLRAVSAGQRIEIIKEKLTNYRLHSGGVTFADPVGTYLEIAFIFKRHMIPLVDSLSDQKSKGSIFNWFMLAPQALELTQRQRYRVFGYLAGCVGFDSYRDFREWVLLEGSASEHRAAEEVGRNIVSVLRYGPALGSLSELKDYLPKVVAAREWWHQNSDRWEAAFHEVQQERDALATQLRHAQAKLQTSIMSTDGVNDRALKTRFQALLRRLQ
ncbi:glycosyltransferase family 2 protein [Microvirga calopogonii]|uniref:glycosyltransferase family 2 protein n=1 Tax=Microvirga calopogonii TaxID=2078013 RepID=UPI000E0CF5EF|nr:glycosyltransferase [Microvirga calopogonii]